MSEDYGTIWVCTHCMLSHASGECCDSEQHGGDGHEPLSLITGEFSVAMGGDVHEHCDNSDECDCERETYSTSQCEGCGSYLHGERHAMTLFGEDTTTYKVTRFFRNSGRRYIIKTGLTLALAQAHCSDPETSSSTCTNAAGKRRTRRSGPWFDGYGKE